MDIKTDSDFKSIRKSFNSFQLSLPVRNLDRANQDIIFEFLIGDTVIRIGPSRDTILTNNSIFSIFVFLVWLDFFAFNSLSNFVGYIMPKSFLLKNSSGTI